jgi:glycerophosphoryl diester phosphodiesterase
MLPASTARTATHPALDRARRLVFAHRGGARLRPENTLAAFDHGLAVGADGLELDVQLSRDGEVVVCHDPTLDRTTNGSGAVRERTADELAQVDAGHHFAPEQGYPFRAQRVGIPRLRDVLARYPGVPMIVELKGKDAELARAAVAVVADAGALDRVCFGGFVAETMQAARAAGPGLVTGASTPEVRRALTLSRMWLWPRRPPYDALQVPERSGDVQVVSPRFVGAAHRSGVPVQVWTVNDEADMWRLLAWGVDALISDRPDVATAVVRRWRRDPRPPAA